MEYDLDQLRWNIEAQLEIGLSLLLSAAAGLEKSIGWDKLYK